jgi:hypothetical protein
MINPRCKVSFSAAELLTLDKALKAGTAYYTTSRKITDNIFGGLGKVETSIPQIVNVDMKFQTSEANAVENAKSTKSTLELNGCRITAFSQTRIKLVK